MTNAYGRDIDTTYLDPETAAYRQVLHRDMAAHNFRWSYVCRFLRVKKRHQTFRVLDAGCGRLVNLAKMMYHNMLTHGPKASYTGVDYGKIPWPETIKPDTKKFNMRLFEKTDFASWSPPSDWPKVGRKVVDTFDLITSFEVLEHVEPYHSFQMLQNMRRLVDRNGCAIISTPVYSPKVGAAKNHVNEMSFKGLQGLIEASGWEVELVYGTFASQTDYKKHLKPDFKYFMDQLSNYYDSTAISLIMAPLIPPEQARNCMWVLTPGTINNELLGTKELAAASNSNSTKWAAARRKILKETK